MISHCANPRCTLPFHYLGAGASIGSTSHLRVGPFPNMVIQGLRSRRENYQKSDRAHLVEEA